MCLYKETITHNIIATAIIVKSLLMSSDARTLKYGDVIRIHGMSKGSPSKGILVSKG
jgi:hypothetical protein